MTTPSELAAIRERWAGAGPWFFTALGDIEDENGRLLAAFGTSAEGPLFAAAPTDIHTLLAALDAACAERDTLLAERDAANARFLVAYLALEAIRDGMGTYRLSRDAAAQALAEINRIKAEQEARG